MENFSSNIWSFKYNITGNSVLYLKSQETIITGTVTSHFYYTFIIYFSNNNNIVTYHLCYFQSNDSKFPTKKSLFLQVENWDTGSLIAFPSWSTRTPGLLPSPVVPIFMKKVNGFRSENANLTCFSTKDTPN